MTTSSEPRWKASIFSGQKLKSSIVDIYFGFIVTRQTALPIHIVPLFSAGGAVDAKSYFAVAKILCARPSWVADLGPDLTTCDMETSEPDHPPSGSRPQGWTNRVRPSPALRL